MSLLQWDNLSTVEKREAINLLIVAISNYHALHPVAKTIVAFDRDEYEFRLFRAAIDFLSSYIPSENS